MAEKEMRNKFGDLISNKQNTDKNITDQNKVKSGEKGRARK